MANIKERIAIQYSPVLDNAALRGAQIGVIGTGTAIMVDLLLEKDKYVPIVGPAGLGPTWKDTGKQGWIELAHTIPVSEKQHKYITIVDATTGAVISCTQLS